MINALISFAELEQRCSSKYKDLKRNLQEVKQKGIALEKINNDLYIKIRILENTNEELQNKCDKDHKIILKFTKGQENLDKLLCTQRASFNKEGIGYNHFNKKKTYKNFFVRIAPYKEDTRTCKVSHITYSCPFKKPSYKATQIGVPKGTKPPNMITNAFEYKFNVKSSRKV